MLVYYIQEFILQRFDLALVRQEVGSGLSTGQLKADHALEDLALSLFQHTRLLGEKGARGRRGQICSLEPRPEVSVRSLRARESCIVTHPVMALGGKA